MADPRKYIESDMPTGKDNLRWSETEKKGGDLTPDDEEQDETLKSNSMHQQSMHNRTNDYEKQIPIYAGNNIQKKGPDEEDSIDKMVEVNKQKKKKEQQERENLTRTITPEPLKTPLALDSTMVMMTGMTNMMEKMQKGNQDLIKEVVGNLKTD